MEMSSDAASNNASKESPINVFFLDTKLLTYARDILEMETGQYVLLDSFQIYQLPDEFLLQISRATPTHIMATVIRLPKILPDSGYFLRFYISALGINERPKHADMHYQDSTVSVLYILEDFRKKLLEMNMPSYIWRFKVVVKMFESTNLTDSKSYEAYQYLCDDMKRKSCKSERQLKNMLYLLGRPALSDLFSGRQDSKFGTEKLGIIARSFAYSKEFAQYMKAIAKDGPKPPPPEFRVFLNHIMYIEKGPISSYGLLVAYFRSYHFGLTYLQVIIREFMKQNLKDLDFLTEIITAADHVEDMELFNEASDIFLANLQTIKNSDTWKTVVNRDISSVESVFHSIRVRMTSEELYIPPAAEHKVKTQKDDKV